MSHFSSWQSGGLALLRMLTGVLVMYHGFEIFDENIINKYLSWDVIKNLPMPVLMVYTGKALELLAGISLLLGWFTRAGGLILCAVMLFICFKVGHGKFWYGDQHPFLFAIIGLIYAFMGPVKWSVDRIHRKR